MTAPLRWVALVLALTACHARHERATSDGGLRIVIGAPAELETSAPAPAATAIEVHVVDAKTVEVDGARMPIADLTAAIAARARTTPRTTAVIRAEPSVPYATVIDVMDRIRAGGVTEIAFGVRPP